MFNHVRSLLLGVTGYNTPGYDFPGEEPVSVDFSPLKLTPTLQFVRSQLFGTKPDRLCLNYRLRQFMNILHATELEEYVLALDPRVTYRTGAVDDLFTGFTVRTEGSSAPIYFAGQFAADEKLGRYRGQWRVAVEPDNTVSVTQETSPPGSRSEVFSVAEGVSSHVALSNGLRCYFDPTPGNVWHITADGRPTRTLADIVDALRHSLTDTHTAELFGGALVEPYKTFWNLWSSNDLLAYRLGGLLLAAAYRIDELPHGFYGAHTANPPPLETPSRLLTGLAAYYKLADNLNDSSGNGNNLVPTGSPAYSTGKIGQGLVDGGGSLSPLNGFETTDRTHCMIAGWFKTPAAEFDGPLDGGASIVLASGSRQASISLRCEIGTGFFVEFSVGTTSSFFGFGIFHAVNTWVHAAIVIGQGAFKPKLYLDGVFVGTVNGTNWNSGTMVFTLNTVGGDATTLLDEVGLWRGERPDEDVTLLFNNGIGVTHPFYGT